MDKARYRLAVDEIESASSQLAIVMQESRVNNISGAALIMRSEWLDHAEGASTGFMVASGGGL